MRRMMTGATLGLATVLALGTSTLAHAEESRSNFRWVGVDQSGQDSATGVVRSTSTKPGVAVQQRAGGSAGGSGSAGRAGAPAGQGVQGNGDSGGPILVPAPAFTPNAGAGVSPQVVAQQAAADLRLPVQAVRVGPDPSLNKWDMLAVGYPVWLWREGPVTSRESVSLSGASLVMVATYESTSYDMGDGQVVRCAVSTPWVKGAQPPGTASPTCGYVYEEPGVYTITATHTWGLEWSGMGASGSFPLTNTSSTTLKVGELASVIIER